MNETRLGRLEIWWPLFVADKQAIPQLMIYALRESGESFAFPGKRPNQWFKKTIQALGTSQKQQLPDLCVFIHYVESQRISPQNRTGKETLMAGTCVIIRTFFFTMEPQMALPGSITGRLKCIGFMDWINGGFGWDGRLRPFSPKLANQ